jgi:hypothetical protein
VTLGVLGYSPLAEKPETWSTLDYGKLIGPSDEYRRSLIKKVLTDTPAGMLAVEAKSALDYRVFGFVDTDQVVSGKGEWLFYKPEFDGGVCITEAKIAQAVDTAEVLRTVAEGAGIEFAISVSPDKSAVEPERLGRRARAEAGCKLASAEDWRRIAHEEGSDIIDHRAAMRAANLHTDLYLATDTHWNELGAATAIRQLAMKWLGVDPGLPRPEEGMPSAVDTDLRTSMLKLPIKETTTKYPAYWQGRFRSSIKNGIRGAVILHDSFYMRAINSFRLLFPDGAFFSLNHPEPEKLRQAIAARPHYFLINSVERRFFPRILAENYSWNSPVGFGLLDANRTVAKACIYEQPVDGGHGAARDPEGRAYMPIALPGGPGAPCLRATFDTAAKMASQLSLSDTKTGAYRESLSVKFTDALGARRMLAIILPARFAGTTVRLYPDMDSGSIPANLSLQTGRSPAGPR